jgi:hypothetical protein
LKYFPLSGGHRSFDAHSVRKLTDGAGCGQREIGVGVSETPWHYQTLLSGKPSGWTPA